MVCWTRLSDLAALRTKSTQACDQGDRQVLGMRGLLPAQCPGQPFVGTSCLDRELPSPISLGEQLGSVEPQVHGLGWAGERGEAGSGRPRSGWDG